MQMHEWILVISKGDDLSMDEVHRCLHCGTVRHQYRQNGAVHVNYPVYFSIEQRVSAKQLPECYPRRNCYFSASDIVRDLGPMIKQWRKKADEIKASDSGVAFGIACAADELESFLEKMS